MRTLKFRGISKFDGKFIYSKGGIFTDSFSALLTQNLESNDKDNLYLSYEEIIPETVGQFTGLTDKNGKDIYEGDVVINGEDKEIIRWNEFYGWTTSELQFLGDSNFAMIEVVGNIHENPELIKATEL